MNLKNLIDKYNKIINNLYIGNYESPSDKEFLKTNNIKLIINCTKNFKYNLDDSINMTRLNITDFNSPENNIIIASQINDILDIINIYINSNEGVLVHCHMGQQRSAMVVACYLMKYYKMNLEDAIKEIKKRRKFVFLPEATFIDFLKYYEIELSYGGFIHKHIDPNDLDRGLYHVRFNIFITEPQEGFKTYYDGHIVDTTEGSYVLCRSGIDHHWSEINEDILPRISLSFGYLLPAEKIDDLCKDPKVGIYTHLYPLVNVSREKT